MTEFKTIKELEKKKKKLETRFNEVELGSSGEYLEVEAELKQTKEICKMIEEDIAYQKTKLTGDFEKDKTIKWRIIGFEELLNKIKGK